jgi:hypothetical protein
VSSDIRFQSTNYQFKDALLHLHLSSSSTLSTTSLNELGEQEVSFRVRRSLLLCVLSVAVILLLVVLVCV